MKRVNVNLSNLVPAAVRRRSSTSLIRAVVAGGSMPDSSQLVNTELVLFLFQLVRVPWAACTLAIPHRHVSVACAYASLLAHVLT